MVILNINSLSIRDSCTCACFFFMHMVMIYIHVLRCVIYFVYIHIMYCRFIIFCRNLIILRYCLLVNLKPKKKKKSTKPKFSIRLFYTYMWQAVTQTLAKTTKTDKSMYCTLLILISILLSTM